MMQISEFSFPHLMAAHEERLTVELERQRVAAERRVEAGVADDAGPAAVRGARSRRWSGSSWTLRGVTRRTAEPCPTCP
jgi:hypothetical protein